MLKFLRSPLGLFGITALALTTLAGLLVPGLIKTFFSPGFFMPHAHCYLNDPRMVWLQGLTDLLIGVSYMLISGTLAYLVYKSRPDLPYEWMFLAFGIFIFSCGCTHFMELWTLWHPTYWLSGAVKVVTAVASVATAIGLLYHVPNIFKLVETAKASEHRRQELVKAHAELEHAYQDLETFSYSLSHDIRGPLRAVSGLNTIVLEDYRENLGDEASQILERSLLAAKRMEQLVNDVLSLSRLSRAHVSTTTINTDALVTRILGARPDLQPPKAHVQLERPLLPIRGDEPSLSQCLDNLLGNAVKFVSPGVTPSVRISTEARDGKVRLWVVDNGIGVAPENQLKIFEPFQRLHPASQYEGTGIGLAIVKKAVTRMGGQVGVESEPGKGSRFWVELPRG